MYAPRLGSVSISARAGFAPKVEELAARAARDANLHHKVKRRGAKWSAWQVKFVSFTQGVQWFTDFEQKVGNEVLVVALWPHKRASCAPDCDPLNET